MSYKSTFDKFCPISAPVFCFHWFTCIMHALPGGLLFCHQRKLHYCFITSAWGCTSFTLTGSFFFSLHKQHKHQDICFSFSCCEQALCFWQKMHFEFSFVHNIKVCSVWNIDSSHQWVDFAASWLHFSIYRLKHGWYWKWAVNFFLELLMHCI